MLKNLCIKNLVLMDSSEIQFSSGLTALTGETGAGKTAMLHGLKLLLGQKLDSSLIRSGEKKGSVQGVFEIQEESLQQILLEADIEAEDFLITIYREVFSDGKSKNFINNRSVPLSFLQKVSSHLIQIVDQSSYHELRLPDTQRTLLDLFSSLQGDVLIFTECFNAFKQMKVQQQELDERQLQKERELSFCLSQEKELSSLNLKEGEEELLFQEYALSAKSQEISEKTDQIFELLNGGNSSALSQASRCKNICETLASTHEVFSESLKLLEQSLISLEEVSHLLRGSLSTFDTDPRHFQKLEEQLQSIDRMKKKYGPCPSDWESYKKHLREKIALFDSLEDDKNALKEQMTLAEQNLNLLSDTLSRKREKGAEILASKIANELKGLNMGEADLKIKVERQARSSSGEDKVSFWLAPNQGESTVNVKDSSSGGELSRLLLAFKICLAEKNSTPTLIFDEIDANVGGETARMIGEKLLALSSCRQIICITHFPQVACQAHLHLRAKKNVLGDRTFTTIEPLLEKTRESELLRMLGGEKNSILSLSS